MKCLPKAKIFSPGLALVFLLFAFTPADNYRYIPNTSFGAGERMEYRVHYGFINAAEARVEVNKSISYINSRPCYRVNVSGRTVGAFDLVSRVRDQWRSYIDTSAILPHMFYREIKENNYRKEETVVFNHKNNTAQASEKDEKKSFKVPDNVHDIISGYYFLRTVNFNRVSEGEIVEVPTFFDGEVYKLRVRYGGRDVVKTKFGKIKVLKLTPQIPDNKFFKGENALRIWVSDDDNKVPIKVQVDLVIGALEMDMKSYRGLRTDLVWL
ncbi:DUF3108 domain-containing protein [Rhabdobacter roseus]|uniref:DUF3108 domain-containing protein n=1 Tax=Rhabdobacter roseus TaxID=1655419 RepID=A0A840TKE1_9BACT|nr:DUF3108 domain-containing protein [Rhabdobacter roseus]MBB5283874.1 hypothetical protein [Rhabdobacter roseus]